MIHTPYDVLGIPPDSDDIQIRKAYLGLVRQYPPERSPEEFQKVFTAYELIKDEESRLKHKLFYHKVPTVEDMVEFVLPRRQTGIRPTAEEFGMQLGQDLRQWCMKLKL